MNWLALLGVISVAYGVFCLYVTIKKPDKIWNMKKVQTFQKVLGTTGTQILFALFSGGLMALGVWLIMS